MTPFLCALSAVSVLGFIWDRNQLLPLYRALFAGTSEAACPRQAASNSRLVCMLVAALPMILFLITDL